MRTLIVTVPGMISKDDWSPLSEVSHVDYVECQSINEMDLAEKCCGYDYLMLNYDVVKSLSSAFYQSDAVRKLKGVSFDITGMDWASPENAAKNGVMIMHTPYYSTESVAEAILCEILLHAKERHSAYFDELNGQSPAERKGIDLLGKNAGIVGLGNIGSRVASLLNGIGMRVFGWNRSPRAIDGVEQVSLEQLFRSCDVVALCLKTVMTGGEKNAGIISKQVLECAKPGMILVNLASCHLVDHAALEPLLSSGKIRGYSVTRNPEALELGLATQARLSFPPANAWHSDESLHMLRKIWVENIVNAINETPTNIYSE